MNWMAKNKLNLMCPDRHTVEIFLFKRILVLDLKTDRLDHQSSCPANTR